MPAGGRAAAELPEVQRGLIDAAAGRTPVLVDRWAFHDRVDRARLVVATGELRL